MNQASFSVSRESGGKDTSHRKKHYSSFHRSEVRADLQELIHHFTEVEKKNRTRREKQKSYIELPGISDLAKRHEELQYHKLLRIKPDSKCHESGERGEKRQRRKSDCAVSEILPVRSRNRNKDLNSAIVTNSELEQSLASLRIESVQNSGHPDNYCVPTKSLPKSIYLRKQPDTSTWQAKEEKTYPSRNEKMSSTQQRLSQHVYSSRDESFSRSHVIECRKVNKNGDSKHERSPVDSLISVPRLKPRQRHRTKEHTLTYAPCENQPPSSVKTITQAPEIKGVRPKSTPKKPARIRQTSVLHLENGTLQSQRNNCLENSINENCITTTEDRDAKSEQNLKVGQESFAKPDGMSENNEEIADENLDFSDDEDKQNDNLVKMLKKIDTQTLKRRLSLDKLDDLDTDDESSLDRMLNQLTAFVESKILRKRAKTNEGRSMIRFGSKSVHLFDPSVALGPLTGSKRPALKPSSILKKKKN